MPCSRNRSRARRCADPGASRFLSCLRRRRLQLLRFHRFPDAGAVAWVGYRTGDVVQKALEGMRASKVESGAGIRVGVEVDDCLFTELVGVLLDPFGRADEAPLFRIPTGEEDRAFGLPSLADGFCQGAGGLHQGGIAADRVCGAVDPGVMVIAVDDPFVWELAAADGAEDVAPGRDGPVEGDPQAHLGGAGTDVIGQRQGAAPSLGRDGAGEIAQDRQRVAPGDGQDRDLRQRLRFADGKLSAAGLGAPAGRQRVAGVGRHVHGRAALHAPLGPERSSG